MALRVALQWAIEQGRNIAWFHMDCQSVVNLFNSSSFNYSLIVLLLEDIRFLSNSFISFRLNFVPRERRA